MTKKKSEKTEEKKVSEETVAEETETENTEEPAKDENADKIKALEDELSAQKDKYMRLAAEYDNYRKRTANEKLSSMTMQLQRLVSSFFPLQTA